MTLSRKSFAVKQISKKNGGAQTKKSQPPKWLALSKIADIWSLAFGKKEVSAGIPKTAITS
jgi:hypothetical protein